MVEFVFLKVSLLEVWVDISARVAKVICPWYVWYDTLPKHIMEGYDSWKYVMLCVWCSVHLAHILYAGDITAIKYGLLEELVTFLS